MGSTFHLLCPRYSGTLKPPLPITFFNLRLSGGAFTKLPNSDQNNILVKAASGSFMITPPVFPHHCLGKTVLMRGNKVYFMNK